MSLHTCEFVQRGTKLLYECSTCKATHHCGLEICEHLVFNRDQTRVCTVTGRCFDQLMSETVGNYRDEPVFVHRVKRDQQIRNQKMVSNDVELILQSVTFIPEQYHHDLIGQICRLWDIVVEELQRTKQYIHRYTRQHFVVVILFSLTNGLTTSNDTIVVQPHDFITVPVVNKKNKFDKFAISDIRNGIKLMKYDLAQLMVDRPIQLVYK